MRRNSFFCFSLALRKRDTFRYWRRFGLPKGAKDLGGLVRGDTFLSLESARSSWWYLFRTELGRKDEHWWRNSIPSLFQAIRKDKKGRPVHCSTCDQTIGSRRLLWHNICPCSFQQAFDGADQCPTYFLTHSMFPGYFSHALNVFPFVLRMFSNSILFSVLDTT